MPRRNKQCISCQRVKPLAAFYRHPQMADRHLNKCKECQKADVKAAREANQEYYREFDRQRANMPHRVTARQTYQKTERGKERMNAGSKAWIARNPEKRAVHVLIGNAIRDGRIERGTCQICGSEKAHAHHNDYSKPFDIWWLCRSCHIEFHKKYPSHQGA